MFEIKKVVVSLVAAATVFVGGCAKDEEPAAAAGPAETVVAEVVAAAPAVAVATMTSRAGLGIVGSVSFSQSEPNTPTAVAVHFEGVESGMHGLHVHEVGDCSAEDFTSAGGHFNPMGVPHGGPEDAERHVGDLGNVECNEDGICHLEIESDLLTVEEGPTSVVGRAVILHEKTDDLVSQPTGAAGSRLACGVVELAG
jgi:Cu-Zn family superoxide dismutase